MAKILLLTPQLPYPPHQGTTLRNYHILKGLARRHEVSLLSFAEPGQDVGPLPALCTALHTVPIPQRILGQRMVRLLTDRRPDMAHRLYSRAFEAALIGVLAGERFDVVQIEGIELAWLMPLVRRHSPASRIVFDDHNAEAELQRRAFLTDVGNPRRWVAALYSWIQAGRLRRYERWACRTADAVVVVSQSDAGHIRALDPKLPVTVIPNCIDVTDYQRESRADDPRFDLVFSGKMDYRPNIDAVLWFAREIWPLVRRERPETTWAIVGQKPHARLDWVKELPGVTVTGWVEAVQPYLAGGAVYIMPFRLGSGTRLKMIEAMAAGKAIVSTNIGAEGFEVVSGREIWLADNAAEFAGAVLTLLADEQERQRLGTAARQVARQYDWRVVVPLFEDVYEESSMKVTSH